MALPTLVNPEEYFDCSKAIILLWTFNVCLQFVISILKFTRYRNAEVPPKLKTFERVMDTSFCLMIISVLNLISVSTYIFATFFTYFFLFLYIFFDIIDHKLPEGKKEIFKMGIPSVCLFMLFLNYWINDQSEV